MLADATILLNAIDNMRMDMYCLVIVTIRMDFNLCIDLDCIVILHGWGGTRLGVGKFGIVGWFLYGGESIDRQLLDNLETVFGISLLSCYGVERTMGLFGSIETEQSLVWCKLLHIYIYDI